MMNFERLNLTNLYTPTMAAEHRGVTVQAIYGAIESGRINTVRVPKKLQPIFSSPILIHIVALEKYKPRSYSLSATS